MSIMDDIDEAEKDIWHNQPYTLKKADCRAAGKATRYKGLSKCGRREKKGFTICHAHYLQIVNGKEVFDFKAGTVLTLENTKKRVT